VLFVLSVLIVFLQTDITESHQSHSRMHSNATNVDACFIVYHIYTELFVLKYCGLRVLKECCLVTLASVPGHYAYAAYPVLAGTFLNH